MRHVGLYLYAENTPAADPLVPYLCRTSGRHISLDQARSALIDSLFGTMKTDPRCNQSREQVFQRYVAPLDDHRIKQLVSIGRDVFDDLSKMGEVKRKLSSTTITAVCEDDRRIRRRLEKEISPVSVVLPMSTSRNEAHHDSPSSHILMVKEGRPHATTIDAAFDLGDVLDKDHWAYYSARCLYGLLVIHLTHLTLQLELKALPSNRLSG